MLNKLKALADRRKNQPENQVKNAVKNAVSHGNFVTGQREMVERCLQATAVILPRAGVQGVAHAGAMGARHLTLAIRLDDPLKLDHALRLGDSLALAAGVPAVLAARHGRVVAYQFELDKELWKSYTLDDVEGPAIGLTQNRRPVDFAVEVAPHCGVFGTTGSGKTETIRTIIATQLGMHSTDELGLILIDPHQDYLAYDGLEHLVAPVARDAQEILQVLTWAAGELERRKANNLRNERRILIVIDEAPRALRSGDALHMVREIAEQARKFRLNLVLGSQNAAKRTLPGIVALLNNRLVGLVANARVSADLTGHAGLQAHKLTGSGDMLHIAGGSVERFQVALTVDSSHLPRCDRVEGPEPNITPVPSGAGRGRPAIELDPEAVAQFLVDPTITRSSAEEHLGLSRKAWRLHRDYALAVEACRALDNKFEMDRYPSPAEVAHGLGAGEDGFSGRVAAAIKALEGEQA